MARVIDLRSITTACPWCSTFRSSMNGCRTRLTKATALMKDLAGEIKAWGLARPWQREEKRTGVHAARRTRVTDSRPPRWLNEALCSRRMAFPGFALLKPVVVHS